MPFIDSHYVGTGPDSRFNPSTTLSSLDEIVAYHNSYFENYVGIATTTKAIALSDYLAMTPEAQEAALMESYNAWAYEEDDSIQMPLTDELAEFVERAENADYRELYQGELERISHATNKTDICYTLFDMNNDDMPELIVKSGTCEANFVLDFYTIKDGYIIQIGQGFQGFHIGFYTDIDTGQFCTLWGQMGVGGINWYDFDGEKVTLARAQDRIEYAVTPDSNDTFDNYGNFSELGFSNLHYSSFDNTWLTWNYPVGQEYEEVAGKNYDMLYNPDLW